MPSRLICACAITALLAAGCSGKAVRSGGDTARGPVVPPMGEFPAGDTERLHSGSGYAQPDPSLAQRQLQDMQAEQRATAAAGLHDVYFGYDSWTISEEGRRALVKNAEWLRAHGTAQLKIEGHCDERGSSAYNMVLGEKRAKSVRNYLMELGVQRERLAVVSYGKERPFCVSRSESCMQQNRRGHLVITPPALPRPATR